MSAGTVIQPAQSRVSQGTDRPTLWGLTPPELHDRFWAARGVQVVRAGEETELVEDAELFLLMAPDLLAVFRLRELVNRLSWIRPDVLWVRLHHEKERGYQEVVLSDNDGQFHGFQRVYGGSDARLARVALTPSREVAGRWQAAPCPEEGWRQLRRSIDGRRRDVASEKARTYDRRSDYEMMEFVRDLVQNWSAPVSTISRIERVHKQVWRDPSAHVDSDATFLGPAWIGAGRDVPQNETVVGPAILWDDPDARPDVDRVQWSDLEPSETFEQTVHVPSPASWHGVAKRTFDLVFAATALLMVLPLFPIVALAIFIEDGRPIFFGHRRESRGGREFVCLKLRSMRRDAEEIKGRLAMANQVDGPQFYMEDDPRVTRVGRFLRKYHVDELPQLVNVLAGQMSIVGPRPSPRQENQCSPAWREARLSVLPGITGLWQVKRTRESGKDFQEWVKYDIEYVETASMRLDLWIIAKTVLHVLRK